MHRVLPQTCLCLCLALVASLPGQDIPELISELGHPSDSNTRREAYYQLRRVDPKGQALPLLLESLPSFPVSSQSLGFSLIRSYPPSPRSTGMRRLLNSDSPYLRLCAASQLFREGEDRHVSRIINELDSTEDESLRLQMMSRLHGINAGKLVVWVRSQLIPGESDQLISAYLGFLLRSRDRDAIASAQTLMESERVGPETRSICAAYLLATGARDASEQLATHLEKTEYAGLSRANRFLSQTENLGKPVYEYLMNILSDGTDPYQLTLALNILGAQAYKPALALIRSHLDSDDARVARAAHEALIGLAHELDPAELHGMLESEDPQQVLMAADLLRRMDDHSGLDEVIGILNRPGPKQAAAADSLGDFRVSAAVAPLIEALESENAAVRAHALDSLEKVLRTLFPYRRLDLRSTGYAAEADKQTRDQGLVKIRAFWTAVRR